MYFLLQYFRIKRAIFFCTIFSSGDDDHSIFRMCKCSRLRAVWIFYRVFSIIILYSLCMGTFFCSALFGCTVVCILIIMYNHIHKVYDHDGIMMTSITKHSFTTIFFFCWLYRLLLLPRKCCQIVEQAVFEKKVAGKKCKQNWRSLKKGWLYRILQKI